MSLVLSVQIPVEITINHLLNDSVTLTGHSSQRTGWSLKFMASTLCNLSNQM